MPIDSRNKRFSLLGLAMASLAVLPAPDATIDQADRQQLAYCYSGILAGALDEVAATPDVIIVASASVTTIIGPAPRTVIAR